MREIGYQPNEFMEKILYKECIQDVEYNPILSGIDMMYITSIIDQVKAEIKKCGDKMKHQKNLQAIINTSMNLGYMVHVLHFCDKF